MPAEHSFNIRYQPSTRADRSCVETQQAQRIFVVQIGHQSYARSEKCSRYLRTFETLERYRVTLLVSEAKIAYATNICDLDSFHCSSPLPESQTLFRNATRMRSSVWSNGITQSFKGAIAGMEFLGEHRAMEYMCRSHSLYCHRGCSHTGFIRSAVDDKSPMSLRLTALVFCPDRFQSRALVGPTLAARAGGGCS